MQIKLDVSMNFAIYVSKAGYYEKLYLHNNTSE